MAYDPALNHLAVVTAARQALYGGAEKLTADQCAALCHEVARRLVALGEADCGVMYKGSGNYGVVNGTGYAVDIILYRDSRVYTDCLRDAGDRTKNVPGFATPVWPTPKPGDVSQWAPPAGGDVPEPPDPPDGDLEARVAALESALLDAAALIVQRLS